MGLDSVELVLELEEAFGVELMDDPRIIDALTPRMIIDIILSKLRFTNENICQRQKAFYIIRRSFLNIFNLERKTITPNMRFRNFIDRSQEKETWQKLKLAVAARNWPELSRPLWMSGLLFITGIAVFITIVFVCFPLCRASVKSIPSRTLHPVVTFLLFPHILSHKPDERTYILIC